MLLTNRQFTILKNRILNHELLKDKEYEELINMDDEPIGKRLEIRTYDKVVIIYLHVDNTAYIELSDWERKVVLNNICDRNELLVTHPDVLFEDEIKHDLKEIRNTIIPRILNDTKELLERA